MYMMEEWIMVLWQPWAAGMDVSSPETGERRQGVKVCDTVSVVLGPLQRLCMGWALTSYTSTAHTHVGGLTWGGCRAPTSTSLLSCSDTQTGYWRSASSAWLWLKSETLTAQRTAVRADGKRKKKPSSYLQLSRLQQRPPVQRGSGDQAFSPLQRGWGQTWPSSGCPPLSPPPPSSAPPQGAADQRHPGSPTDPSEHTRNAYFTGWLAEFIAQRVQIYHSYSEVMPL